MENQELLSIVEKIFTDRLDNEDGSGKLAGLPRSGARESGSGAVGVRFLRTQQRVKSQCLYRSGRLAGSPRAVSSEMVGISLR
ncbi:hypothetical protein, partial [Actinomadura sp. NTSP31]|uniref:hypothetical protein n=1 Tax=Actinomadura sp. NTSP31 TaxID=1735447 RepID=UPI0035C01412